MVDETSFIKTKTKMSKSCLCSRIDICSLISKLNKDGCLHVIRLLQNVEELPETHQLITKMFMDYSNKWTMDQIIQFENELKQTLSNRDKNYYHSHSQSNNVQLSLLRLPIDLLTQTSLYLNEKDIFNFERCCRLFYQMINNTSYLNLSNNFKSFTITNKTLDQMSQKQHSFFKYSTTKHLRLCYDTGVTSSDGSEEIEECFTKLRSKWPKSNDKWFNNMFKSIETIDINADCMVLLDKLPIESLFDPNESHLNEMKFDHYWHLRDDKYLKEYIDKFSTKYLKMKVQLEEQGKQIKQIKVAKHDNLDTGCEGMLYMLVQHLHMDLSNITIDLNKNWLSPHYNPCLQKLTCECDFKFENIDVKQPNSLDNKENININIETLRLMFFKERSSCDIFNNQTVIESLNLQNSLNNLMLDIRMDGVHDEILNQWQNVIELIITKEYFYQLKNVVILFGIPSCDYPSHQIVINWLCAVLEKYVQLVKYQFKQFIIGLNVRHSHYHVLEWNKEIDSKYLDQLKSWCNQNKEKETREQMKQKYFLLRQQWST